MKFEFQRMLPVQHDVAVSSPALPAIQDKTELWLRKVNADVVASVVRETNMKPRPNHRLYLQALRRMTPDERLRKAFELSDFCRRLFLDGLRRRFPNMPEPDIIRIYRERLSKCHNRNC